MSDDIRDLFGGPDSPDEMAQMPADDELPKEGDEFEDGFAADPQSADLDDFAEPFEDILRDKVETYNEEFEDGDEKNDRVTEDMIAAVAHRARGAYEPRNPDILLPNHRKEMFLSGYYSEGGSCGKGNRLL
jgi:hypothetical protein